MRFLDITTPIRSGMPVYPGDPPVAVAPHLAVSRGDPVNVSTLTLGSHTGTHLDAPRHLGAEGAAVDELPLALLLGPALVMDLGPVPAIEADALARSGRLDLGDLPRLLLKTAPAGSGASEHPPLTEDAARLLLDADVRLVGIEGLSVDAPSATELPVHRLLLGAGVLILEGLDLSAVAPGEYELVCLPLKLHGGDGAPVRAALVQRASAPPPGGGRRARRR